MGDIALDRSVGHLLKEAGKVKVSSLSSLLSHNLPLTFPGQTSKTFPSQCRASMEAAIINLETVATIQAMDLQGTRQECGGDPVTAEVVSERGATLVTSVTGLQCKYAQIEK